MFTNDADDRFENALTDSEDVVATVADTEGKPSTYVRSRSGRPVFVLSLFTLRQQLKSTPFIFMLFYGETFLMFQC